MLQFIYPNVYDWFKVIKITYCICTTSCNFNWWSLVTQIPSPLAVHSCWRTSWCPQIHRLVLSCVTVVWFEVGMCFYQKPMVLSNKDVRVSRCFNGQFSQHPLWEVSSSGCAVLYIPAPVANTFSTGIQQWSYPWKPFQNQHGKINGQKTRYGMVWVKKRVPIQLLGNVGYIFWPRPLPRHGQKFRGAKLTADQQALCQVPPSKISCQPRSLPKHRSINVDKNAVAAIIEHSRQ